MLVLAIAVNLEPTRIGLLPLLLSRRQPLLQLLAYLVGSLTISLGFGLAVLFVFDESVFGTSASGGGKAQIAVGVLALLVAAVMAVRGLRTRRGSGVPSTVPADAGGDGLEDRPASVRYDIARLPGVLAVEAHRTVPARLRNRHLSRREAVIGVPGDGELEVLKDATGARVPLLDGGDFAETPITLD